MLKELINKNSVNGSIEELIVAVRQGIPSAVFGVNDSFKCYLASKMEDPVLMIVRDDLTANSFADMIKAYGVKKVVSLCSKDEILVSNRAFSKERLYKRIVAVKNMKDADVIVATPDALMQAFPKETYSLTFEKNKDYDREDYLSTLVKMGYKRTESIEGQGTFSLRGDILDVYPINTPNPVKIDFFGDTVDGIKVYDLSTREKLSNPRSVEILQAVDVTLKDQDFQNIYFEILKEVREFKGDKTRIKEVADDVEFACKQKDADALSVFSSITSSVTDFTSLISKNAVVFIDEGKRVKTTAEITQKEFNERYKTLLTGGEIFSFEKNNLIDYERLKELLSNYRQVAVQNISSEIHFFNPLKIINPEVSGVSDYRASFKEAKTDIINWLTSGYKVYACAPDKSKARVFSDSLYNYKIPSVIDAPCPKGCVNIAISNLNTGFIYHEDKTVVLGAGNLFLQTGSIKKKSSKRRSFFTAPEAGDYCVHEIHGIGRVMGNKKITTSEGTKDYIAVEYYGGDILYVPVEQMDILTRYLGGDKAPKLSKIGGIEFEKVKNNVKQSIKEMSFDLKKLYEERESLVGFKFTPDVEMEDLFKKSFRFTDTIDQTVAISEIRKDMTSGKVMDRLVCGDVGFGKTEVALRAIFLAVINGKQCAMLAPTTILTEQHYTTATERLSSFGVKIACLNRFRTPKQQEKIIRQLKEGEIDLIIGTHRLLSSDVGFKDLGLLVLDEEQRFGVEHKEKIKLLKKNVDTLTLTATPIPRTLHMSLSGIRPISTINTPPSKRLPVQTYVTEETPTLITDAVNREINRGGQVFILYNRVESIYSYAEKIKTLMPSVKVIVAHGQMDERTLEKNILSFYKGEADVLISTTIIENGIDLPKANTLIVIDADKLGLSTLYQLKGRVGRSDRLAYAYFTFKREKILSETAYNRLNAISEFTEMGSGIKIAMRDLEIRGAGNVLGVEQHGHMDKIGYELYSKLLKEELEGVEDVIAELDVRVTAFIPENYIVSRSERMDAYKEIAEIDGGLAEKEVREYLTEQYGKIPPEVDDLITVALVKALAKKYGVTFIKVSKEQTALTFEHFKVFGDESFSEKLNYSGIKTKILMASKPTLEFVSDRKTNSEMLKTLKEFLLFSKN